MCVLSHNGKLLSNKKRNIDTCNKMDTIKMIILNEKKSDQEITEV